MPSLIPQAVLPFLCLIVLAPQVEKSGLKPFPALNSAAAETAIDEGLAAISASELDAQIHPAKLKLLSAELSKHFQAVPSEAQLKNKLLQMYAANQAKAAQLQLTDPDKAALLGPRFAKPGADKKPNPALERVREQTWPATLTNGEKVALQARVNAPFKLSWIQGLRQRAAPQAATWATQLL